MTIDVFCKQKYTMLIKRTKERSQEITPDNRGVIWGKELNGMATDEELYGQYLSGDETGH